MCNAVSLADGLENNTELVQYWTIIMGNIYTNVKYNDHQWKIYYIKSCTKLSRSILVIDIIFSGGNKSDYY